MVAIAPAGLGKMSDISFSRVFSRSGKGGNGLKAFAVVLPGQWNRPYGLNKADEAFSVITSFVEVLYSEVICVEFVISSELEKRQLTSWSRIRCIVNRCILSHEDRGMVITRVKLARVASFVAERNAV